MRVGVEVGDGQPRDDLRAAQRRANRREEDSAVNRRIAQIQSAQPHPEQKEPRPWETLRNPS